MAIGAGAMRREEDGCKSMTLSDKILINAKCTGNASFYEQCSMGGNIANLQKTVAILDEVGMLSI
eukprot:11504371-Ditylum_brightwellii.AAC.1